MIKVANRKVITKLSFRSFKANKIRNIIAVIAIILTSILFTSLFTVAVSFNYSMEQQYMRMVGGYSHGGFKYVSKAQVDQLKVHPLIKEYGTTLTLGFPDKAPFNKHHTEIRYGDTNGAKMFYSNPTTGRMPKEKMELATDTAVLDLLGIPHKIGEKVTLSYPLGKKTITDTFTLCGFWQTDEAMLASQIWLSEAYVTKQLLAAGIKDSTGDLIGTWSLDVMFSNSRHIEQDLRKVTEDNGYNLDDKSASNYLPTGVNWSYTSTHLNKEDSLALVLTVLVIGLLILFAGYLIIYNIFQISVTGDIRYYGLLKTIGTTKRQIRRLIRNQAFLLSGIGIPFGLIAGYFIGGRITTIMMNIMSSKSAFIAHNAWIFIGAALFSLITVGISCRKPGRMAAGVSPIEAVRYSEGGKQKRKYKNTKKGAKVYQMAKANLGLNIKKTVLVITSLSLSIILLNTTYSFTKGFDMDKYLSKFVITDFIAGHADYFQSRFYEEGQTASDSMIQKIEAQAGITESGRIYNGIFRSTILMSSEDYKKWYNWIPKEDLDQLLKQQDADGNIKTTIELYGLDDFPMKQLSVLEGTLDLEKLKSGHYLIQVTFADDYGKPELDQLVYKIGDKIKVHYSTDFNYTEEGKLIEHNGWDQEYEIIANVMMPGNMSRRSYGSPQFAMSADTYLKDTGKNNTMIYMLNVDKAHVDQMEQFIKNYTDKTEPDMGYESKKSLSNEFVTFRNMFLLVGSVLSLIIGIVGILNFVNAEITSIIARRREFATLLGIGMTGKQLKKMLIYEGMFYGVISILVSLIISVAIGFFALKPVESVIWFFSYHLTVTPILLLLPVFLILGIAIPLVAYQATNRKSIVERIREAE
jgi:putative ABC transport system permease protein